MCRVCVYVCVCFRLGTSVLVVVSVCIHERTHARTRLFTHMQGHSGEKSGRECPGSLWLLGLALRSWCVSGGVCVGGRGRGRGRARPSERGYETSNPVNAANL